MTAYSDIVKRIKEAVPEAASTANHPEAKGRPDTVFNRLILEYKKPGVIKENNEKNRQLITQVKGCIEDLSKEEIGQYKQRGRLWRRR